MRKTFKFTIYFSLLLFLTACHKSSSNDNVTTGKESISRLSSNDIGPITPGCNGMTITSDGTFLKVNGIGQPISYGVTVSPSNGPIFYPPSTPYETLNNTNGTYSDNLAMGAPQGSRVVVCATSGSCSMCKTFVVANETPTSPRPAPPLSTSGYRVVSPYPPTVSSGSSGSYTITGVAQEMSKANNSTNGCPIPIINSQVDATDTSVDIRVLYPPNIDGPLYTLIRYREIGTTSWEQKCYLLSSNYGYLINIYGLEIGVTYEVQAAFMCSESQTGDWSNIFNISTIP